MRPFLTFLFHRANGSESGYDGGGIVHETLPGAKRSASQQDGDRDEGAESPSASSLPSHLRPTWGTPSVGSPTAGGDSIVSEDSKTVDVGERNGGSGSSASHPPRSSSRPVSSSGDFSGAVVVASVKCVDRRDSWAAAASRDPPRSPLFGLPVVRGGRPRRRTDHLTGRRGLRRPQRMHTDAWVASLREWAPVP